MGFEIYDQYQYGNELLRREVTNLSETHEPLFAMLKELSVTGQETARVMYGAKGWVAHHNTDLWRITGPVDNAFTGHGPMAVPGFRLICGNIIYIRVIKPS